MYDQRLSAFISYATQFAARCACASAQMRYAHPVSVADISVLFPNS